MCTGPSTCSRPGPPGRPGLPTGRARAPVWALVWAPDPAPGPTQAPAPAAPSAAVGGGPAPAPVRAVPSAAGGLPRAPVRAAPSAADAPLEGAAVPAAVPSGAGAAADAGDPALRWLPARARRSSGYPLWGQTKVCPLFPRPGRRPTAAGLCPAFGPAGAGRVPPAHSAPRFAPSARLTTAPRFGLSRCACSRRAASLRLGRNPPPLRGGWAFPPASLHPRGSRRLRASFSVLSKIRPDWENF